MQFLIVAHDGAGMLERRLAVRGRHLENMEKMKEHVVCAGGLLDAEGKMAGSALVLDFPSRAEVDAYLAGEPYVQEKVWEKVDVTPINVVLAKGEKYGK